MRLIYFIFLALAFTACTQTTLYSPGTGKRLANFQGNYRNVKLEGGGVTFSAESMTHSATTRAAWDGANRMGNTVVSGAVGVLVPGTGTTAAVERAAIVSVPHITAPKAPKTNDQ